MTFPSIFLSHGAPTLAVELSPARNFLGELGRVTGKPAAILCMSAHWEAGIPTLGSAADPETIHDFGGFASELYELRYPAPGAVRVAERAAELLDEAGVTCALDGRRGLDHGAWIPLRLMYPEADVPVSQLSLRWDLEPAYHYRLGRVLAPLRDDGVLILGSGGAVHNLRQIKWAGGEPETWAKAFDEWLDGVITEGDLERAMRFADEAPHAAEAHPRAEHLIPLFTAWGAAGDGAKGKRLHESWSHANLSLSAYAFG